MADAANMKKRIFIAAHYLEIGGAEISLIGLLNALNFDKVDVDLFLYEHRGELMRLIPKQVNLLPRIPAYAQIENPIKEVIRNGYFRQALARIRAKLKYRKWAKINNPATPEAFFQYLDNEIMPTLPSLTHFGHYDLAVNFIALKNNIPTKVDATKTGTWIHTDFSSIPVNAELEHDAWAAYNHIVSISPQVTASFSKIFPDLNGKIVEIENILSPQFVRSRAEEDAVSNQMTGSEETVKLLSIGRFCNAKNYDNVPDIAYRIIQSGIKIKWFIIGFGGDEQLIRQHISEAGMDEYVILLGKQTNPYPFIKECDIYVQPSRYEGKSVTVREAQMLCKPVVVTNYPTASSQVNDGVDGVIVPLDNEGCAKGLIEFISNTKLQKKIIDNLNSKDFGNEHEVQKFYNLIND